jgi:hypothetical protein
MRFLRFASLLLLVMLLFPALHLDAKGRPDRVVVSGPGLKQPVEITDRQTLDVLGMGGLENRELSYSDKVPAVGEGYDLVRYIEEPGRKPIAFDHVRYFPKAADGHSYVFYVGLVDVGSWSSLDHKWYTVNPAGQTAMERILAKYVPDGSVETVSELTEVPQNCKAGPALTASTAFAVPALKLNDLTWAAGFSGPNATLKIAGTTASAKPDVHGWPHEVIWLAKKGSFYRITLWARNLEDNRPVWFELAGQQPTTMLTLTPKLASASERTDGWIEFTSKVHLPKAGCYELNVFANEKVVPIAFAAGR